MGRKLAVHGDRCRPWMMVRGSDDVEGLVGLVRVLVVDGGPEPVVVRLVGHDLHAAIRQLHFVLSWNGKVRYEKL